MRPIGQFLEKLAKFVGADPSLAEDRGNRPHRDCRPVGWYNDRPEAIAELAMASLAARYLAEPGFL
jgi:hypothetical protein